MCIISSAQEKNIRVRYIKGLKKITDTTSRRPLMMKNLYYTLITNGKESLYYYKNGLKITGQEINKRFIKSGNDGGVFYKNIDKKEYVHQETFQDELYLINLKEKNWILTKEKQKINNYLCYKAVSQEIYFNEFTHKKMTTKYIAWYTPEISIPFGPNVFNGLPGLVIAGQIDGYYYFADKIEVNVGKKIITKPNKGILISEKEMKKKINELGKMLYKKYGRKQ